MALGGCQLQQLLSTSLLPTGSIIWWQSPLGQGEEERKCREPSLLDTCLSPCSSACALDLWSCHRTFDPATGPAKETKATFYQCSTDTLKAAWSDRDSSNCVTCEYKVKVPRYILRCTAAECRCLPYHWYSVCYHIFTERLHLFEENDGTTTIGRFKAFICWCSCTRGKVVVAAVTCFSHLAWEK